MLNRVAIHSSPKNAQQMGKCDARDLKAKELKLSRS